MPLLHLTEPISEGQLVSSMSTREDMREAALAVVGHQQVR
jgi:hypothetical protein